MLVDCPEVLNVLWPDVDFAVDERVVNVSDVDTVDREVDVFTVVCFELEGTFDVELLDIWEVDVKVEELV